MTPTILPSPTATRNLDDYVAFNLDRITDTEWDDEGGRTLDEALLEFSTLPALSAKKAKRARRAGR